jgi:hypothetical protein
VAERTPRHRAKRRYIAIDTKYLGTVHGVPARAVLSLTMHNYALVKANIDELPALQLELTICDEDNNLLVVIKKRRQPLQLAWEFNFYDFKVVDEVVEALRATSRCARLYPEVFVPLTTTRVNCDNTEALRLLASDN